MRINNNMMAANTHRQLNVNQAQGSKSLEKLSSGLRINRAGDDAAGLAISEKMRGQIRGLNQATRNAQDGISLIQTAEGALNETHAILQRMRELAVQSATDTNAVEDRTAIQAEFAELSTEITRIANDTEFNGQKLLTGTFTGKSVHIGSNAGQTLVLEIGNMDAAALIVGAAVGGTPAQAATSTEFGGVTWTAATPGVAGNDIQIEFVAPTLGAQTLGASLSDNVITVTLETADASTAITSTYADVIGAINTAAGGLLTASGTASTDVIASQPATIEFTGGLAAGAPGTAEVKVDSQAAANAAITSIDNAISAVSSQRANLGAVQNRLEHTISNLGTSSENLQAAESRIRDVDMAAEMMQFTKNNILQQAATAMLAQANQAPQTVLQLLR